MKVPDLEDMIQQQVNAESYICEACDRPLMEHHLVENAYFMFVCCYPNNQNQRFKSKTGMSVKDMPMGIMSISKKDGKDESSQS